MRVRVSVRVRVRVCVCVRLEVCYGQKNLGHHLGAHCLSWDNTHATVSDSVALFTFFCICSMGGGAGRGEGSREGLGPQETISVFGENHKFTNSNSESGTESESSLYSVDSETSCFAAAVVQAKAFCGCN